MQKSGRLMAFDGPGKPFRLEKQPLRALQPGEILVRTLYTTICGSDLHTYCGLRQEPCPTVLGHEIVGQIVEIHPEHGATDLLGEILRPGDRITWTIFTSNPQSANSLRGIPQKGEGLFKYGHARVTADDAFHGGLAEYCVLKAHTGIIRLPESMPDAVAATLNCSVSTVAGALRMAGEIKGKNVLITGMGHLGVTCAAMCREAGAAWIAAADISEKRLEEAKRFGANELIDMRGEKAMLPKNTDLVFDMSGSPDAMEFGLAALGIGGCAIWIGAVFNTRPLQIDPEKVIRNLLTVKGLHNYNFDDFRYAFGFMRRNWEKYPFGSVVEKEFPLDEVKEAFEYALQNKPLRVGIRL